eukprot:6929475-Pyramimonas_sp.AAC.1
MDKQQVVETFRVIREEAGCNELEPILADDAYATAAKMSARAGLGVDMFTQVDFQRLPRSAILEMASIPQLIPKKQTGDRAIGILTMVARLWSLLREPLVRSWSSQKIAAWDAAVEGNS